MLEQFRTECTITIHRGKGGGGGGSSDQWELVHIDKYGFPNQIPRNICRN